MSQLYFDVTQLIHWQGNLTGIPRVMHELATRFDMHGAVMVAWVKEAQAFCEVDLEGSLQTDGIKYKSANHDRQPILKRAVKYAIQQVSRVSPRLSQGLRRAVAKALGRRYQTVEFQLGDRLLVSWGEWHDPNFTMRLNEWHQLGLKVIQMVHDMGPVVVPQLAGASSADRTFPAYHKAVLPICNLVLAVSQHTKRDIIKWLEQTKLQVPPIAVFREGDDFKVANPQKPDNFSVKDFILCVGTIEAKKNHELLYKVYKLAKTKSFSLPKLVVVGRLGWRTEALYKSMTQDSQIKDQLVFLHNASDEELSWLYDNCLFSIFPSRFEGWGIPVAESLSRGVPVLASNATSIPEVGGEYAQYFSPDSAEECLAKIIELLKPGKLAEAKAKVKQYKPTSWNDSYNQVAKHLGKIK